MTPTNPYLFADRDDAGRQLAAALRHLRPGGQAPDHGLVVVGLPRGGVPVAADVAEELRAALDVILVRKLGVPGQPELAMGAIGEDMVRITTDDVIRRLDLTTEDLAEVEARERIELERRGRAYRAGRPRVPLRGRVVVVVDDGVATGSTARAACEVARAEGAARVVLAVPLAPTDWVDRLGDVADEFVAVRTPDPFVAIGRFYRDFSATTDDEVIDALDRARSAWIER